MVKLAITHYIIDYALGNFFNAIFENFAIGKNNNVPPLETLKIGNKFREIIDIQSDRLYRCYNCVLTKVDQSEGTIYFKCDNMSIYCKEDKKAGWKLSSTEETKGDVSAENFARYVLITKMIK